MAATSGTRRGRGVGHGGPAKGFVENPPKAFTPEDAAPYKTDRPAHLDNADPVEQAFRAERRQEARDRKAKAWAALDALVDDRDHPFHGNAIRETLNRTEGLPVQKVENSGPNGGAIVTRIERVIVDPQNKDG